MRRLVPLGLIGRLLCLLAWAGGPACFVDTPQPPAFRFKCGSDAECTEPEQCISGLCQVTCAYATFDEDCPTDGGYATCFNGVCAHVCAPDDEDACPSPHSCVEIPLGDDSGGSSMTELGVCGEPCKADDCPSDEVCVAGICVPIDDGGTDTGETGGTGA